MLPVFNRLSWLSWVFAAVAIAFSGLALRDAAAAVFSRTHPALVLAIDPADPRALPVLLDRMALVSAEGSSSAAEIAGLRAGLREMPLSARILRQLAVAEELQSQSSQASNLLSLAGYVSRRDTLTEVLLANGAARRGDPDVTMQHINAALSTNRAALDLVYPFLVEILRDPGFRPIVAQYVDQPWGDEFMLFAARTGMAVDALDVALRNPVVQTQSRFAPFRSELLTHLVAQGQADLAFDYARRLKGSLAAILKDFGFTSDTADPAFAPLSWALTSGEGLYADLVGRGVMVSADPGARGTALHRVVELSPGTWQLTARGALDGNERNAVIGWQIDCLDGVESELLNSYDWRQLARETTVQTRFTLTSSCDAVRVSLLVHNLGDHGSLELRLDEFAMQRIES